MSPVHWSPVCTIRMILIKQMILSIMIRKSIRVIHPADSWSQVKRRSFIWSNFFFFPYFIFSRLNLSLIIPFPPKKISKKRLRSFVTQPLALSFLFIWHYLHNSHPDISGKSADILPDHIRLIHLSTGSSHHL